MDVVQPRVLTWQNGTSKEEYEVTHMYTGEDKDDIIDNLGISDMVEDGELCPVVEIHLATLGKIFSFKMTEPRIKREWHDCELVDIDKRYVEAPFFSTKKS